MKNEDLLEVLGSVQYALDSIDTAKANGWISRPAFFDTASGELRSAKIRIKRALKEGK